MFRAIVDSGECCGTYRDADSVQKIASRNTAVHAKFTIRFPIRHVSPVRFDHQDDKARKLTDGAPLWL